MSRYRLERKMHIWYAMVACTVLTQVTAQTEMTNSVANNSQYNPECGMPGGPCGPGYGYQFNYYPGPEYCPDPQPCPSGYFCEHPSIYEWVQNRFSPQPKQCGEYLKNCCVPRMCNGTGENGEPLTCQATGGPYFAPAGGLCMPNPKCGKEGQPCCQSWGNRDYWKRKERHDGEKGHLCEGSLYCQFDNCRRTTPISGTCVPNLPECGVKEGAPCCIRSRVTYEAYDAAVQEFYCADGTDLECDSYPDMPICTRKQSQNVEIFPNEILQCGKPGGACAPAWNGSTILNTLDFGTKFVQLINNCTPEELQCPPEYFCGIRNVPYVYSREFESKFLPACIGPVDAECGKESRPCCPWQIDASTGEKIVDGELWCDATNVDGTPLQCISKDDLDVYSMEMAIKNSKCVLNKPCGSLGESCCRFVEENSFFHFENPAQSTSIQNRSLACEKGLYCNYTDFLRCPSAAFMYSNPSRLDQGTCIANAKDCGLEVGKPCCVRSLRYRGYFPKREVYYCDVSKSLVCDPSNKRVQFGHGVGDHPLCVNETTAESYFD